MLRLGQTGGKRNKPDRKIVSAPLSWRLSLSSVNYRFELDDRLYSIEFKRSKVTNLEHAFRKAREYISLYSFTLELLLIQNRNPDNLPLSSPRIISQISISYPSIASYHHKSDSHTRHYYENYPLRLLIFF